MSEKLSHEEFVKKAIMTLRKEGYKGIHSVYSGFNNAFKKYFDGENPVNVTNKLAQEGKVIVRPVKGGVMLYLPEEAPGTSEFSPTPSPGYRSGLATVIHSSGLAVFFSDSASSRKYSSCSLGV